MAYNHNQQIPKPILFNCWKHHLGFIKSELESIEIKSKNDIKNFAESLKVMGDSLSDLYLGSYSPSKISGFIISDLKSKRLFAKEKFIEWLFNDEKDYKLIRLPDNSNWTIMLGKDKEKYVHIHPARYSLHTIRVKSVSLKTASIVFLRAKHFGGSPFDLSTVNKVRTEFLKYSPVKNISHKNGLGKIISFFVES